MTKRDFAALLDELATPIDFPDLVGRGILKRTGRGVLPAPEARRAAGTCREADVFHVPDQGGLESDVQGYD
jgi:hypothetical protein